MKQLIMSEMADFECIGGKCPDTCCAGWKIYIDKKTEQFYGQVEGEIGDRIRKNIKTDESGRCLFEMLPNNRCPFLNEQNLCQIYRTIGPEAMCDTCRDYPRVLYPAGDIVFAALSISCPEAGRMILGKSEKAQYVFTEDESSVLGNDTDWERFNNAIRTYTTIQGILQERCLPLKERLIAVTVYTYQIQEMTERSVETAQITQLFQNPDMYSAAIEPVVCSQRSIAEKFKFIRLYINTTLKTFQNRHLIAELKTIASYLSGMPDEYAGAWYEGFNEFDACVPETEREQLLVYLLFRHFMDKYKNRSIWESLIFMLAFFSAYRCLTVLHFLCTGEFPDFEWRILMVARMSRDYEHSDAVWRKLYECMSTEGADQLDFLLDLIN